ncbi:MAG: hypothetical protein D6729_01920 [Deltaproteobacteria bacterium]|nr:MAG: hypothetical protein D6729_01920 [Deltaproteobacteria bacterium]
MSDTKQEHEAETANAASPAEQRQAAREPEAPSRADGPEQTQAVRRAGEETAEKLEAFIDRLNLKMHLAGMDARAAWEEKVRPRLSHMAAELRRAAREVTDDETRLQAHLAMMELRDRWERLYRHLGPIADHLRNAGDVAADELEAKWRALVEEAEDDPEEDAARHARLRQEIEKAGDDIEALTRDALKKMGITLEGGASEG